MFYWLTEVFISRISDWLLSTFSVVLLTPSFTSCIVFFNSDSWFVTYLSPFIILVIASSICLFLTSFIILSISFYNSSSNLMHFIICVIILLGFIYVSYYFLWAGHCSIKPDVIFKLEQGSGPCVLGEALRQCLPGQLIHTGQGY